ncbi:hypothetical protein Pmani_001733 [Petrolisthes manimaculis]|uniref:Uncharacterized protein n=1 Tax=Petrolisthes manimaculis TaxID=1843537 RepID=A0AAE1QLP3_9EUCA|nr:hypothetical protein Pmani_001733 [Petrolisthes manimaculis]
MLSWAKKHVQHTKHSSNNKDAGDTDQGVAAADNDKDKWKATCSPGRKLSREERGIREEEASDRKLEAEKSPSFTRRFASLRKMATLKRSTDKRDKSKSPDKGIKEKSKSPDKRTTREKSESPDQSSDSVSWKSARSVRETSRSPDKSLEDDRRSQQSPDRCVPDLKGPSTEPQTTQGEQGQTNCTQQQQQRQQPPTLTQHLTLSQPQQQPTPPLSANSPQLTVDINGQSTDDGVSNSKLNSIDSSNSKMQFENVDPAINVETGVDKETKESEDREKENTGEVETKEKERENTDEVEIKEKERENTGEVEIKEKERENTGEMETKEKERENTSELEIKERDKENTGELEIKERDKENTGEVETKEKDREKVESDSEIVHVETSDNNNGITSNTVKEDTNMKDEMNESVVEKKLNDFTLDVTTKHYKSVLECGNAADINTQRQTESDETKENKVKEVEVNDSVISRETRGVDCSPLRTSSTEGSSMLTSVLQTDNENITSSSQPHGNSATSPEHHKLPSMHNNDLAPKDETCLEIGNSLKESTLLAKENDKQESEADTILINDTAQDDRGKGEDITDTEQEITSSKQVTETVDETEDSREKPLEENTEDTEERMAKEKTDLTQENNGLHVVEEEDVTGTENNSPVIENPKNDSSSSDTEKVRTEGADILTEPEGESTLITQEENIAANSDKPPLPLKVRQLKQSQEQINHNRELDSHPNISDSGSHAEMNGSVDRICLVSNLVTQSTNVDDTCETDGFKLKKRRNHQAPVSSNQDTLSHGRDNSSSQSVHVKSQSTSNSSLTNIQVQKVSTPSQGTQLPSPLEKESSTSNSSLPSTQTQSATSQAPVGGSLPASPSAPKRHKRAPPVPSTRSLQSLHPPRQNKPSNKMCDAIISSEVPFNDKAPKEMPVPAPRKNISLNPFDSEEDEDEVQLEETLRINEENRSENKNVSVEASRAKDNNIPTPVPAPRTKVSLNPFDSDDDEEEEVKNVTNKNATTPAASGPLKTQVIGKNPFEDEEDEEKDLAPQRTSSPSLASNCVAASSFGKLNDSFTSVVSNRTLNETTTTNPFDEDEDDEDAVGDNFKRDMTTRQSFGTSSSASGISRDGTRSSLPPTCRNRTGRKKRQAPLPPGQSPMAEKPRPEMQNMSRGSSFSSLTPGGSNTSLNTPDNTPPKRPPPPRPPPPKLCNTSSSPGKH